MGEAGAVTGEVVAAHEAAVDAAVGYLERQVCLSRRRTNGVQHQVAGDGFVAAGFRHQTCRAGDPTLHTHVLIANMTRMPDGWGALHSPPMFHHAKTAGFLYQAQLRAELTRRLGVSWQPVTNGYADVAGIPREVIDEFSKRRAEILDAMEARAEHSAKAAQNVALDTRRAKDYDVDATTLRADWAHAPTSWASVPSRSPSSSTAASTASRSCGRPPRCSMTSRRPKVSRSTRRRSGVVTSCGPSWSDGRRRGCHGDRGPRRRVPRRPAPHRSRRTPANALVSPSSWC